MYKNYTDGFGMPKRLYRKIWLIMRLTTIILLVTFLQVSAATLAQNVTLKKSNASLKSVFSEVKKQTGYMVLYPSALVNDAKPVTVDLNNVPLRDAMNRILENQELEFEIQDKSIVVRAQVNNFPNVIKPFDPLIDVHGRVVDEKGQSMPGVTVAIKTDKVTNSSGNRVTITNEKGEFILKKVDEKAILVISFIGYQKKEVSANSDLANIQMTISDSKLDEVQVQAYGKTSLRLSTGDITSIKAADIEKQPVNNPLLALEGRVPGLQITQTSGLPGAAVNIQLRGQNSIARTSASGTIIPTQPLIIIDGSPYPNNIPGLEGNTSYLNLTTLSALSFISPNDIESIDVLKDADATAIYGSRGANGVILITTKKGKAGSTNVNVNYQSGFGQVGKQLSLLNTQQYLIMRKEAFRNDGLTINNPAGLFDPLSDPDIYNYDSTRNTNWQKKLIGGTAHYTDAQANITGGNQNVQYLIGGTYHKEGTVFPGQSSNQKANLHFNISGLSQNKKLKTSLSGSYMYDWSNFPGIDFTQYILLPPNAPALYNTDGSINFVPYYIPQFNITFPLFINNPYANLNRPYKSSINNLISNLDIRYQIITGLTIGGNLGYSNVAGNSFIALNPFMAQPPGYVGQRESSFNANNVSTLIFEPQLNYKKVLSKGILEVLLGGSYQNSTTKNQSIDGIGYSDDALMTDLASATSYSAFNNNINYRYNAVYGRLNFNWDQKYIVNINGRRDGSSRFGPGRQFGNFGSIGAAWIFSNENVVKNALPFLSFGKLRASYGTTGNDGIPDYGYLEKYKSLAYVGPYQGTNGLASEGLSNPYYQWETTKKLEAAIELGFFEDRIYLQASYYRNRSSNQLIAKPLPSFAGLSDNLISNSPATIQNSGLEYAITAIAVKNNNFTWKISGNISFNRNKLLAYPNLQLSTDYLQYQIGQPINLTRVYKYAGINTVTGLYQFYDSNGGIVDDPSLNGGYVTNKVGYVNTAPKFMGGIQNTFSYKRFSLDIFIQFTKQQGLNALYSLSIPGVGFSNLGNQFVNVLDRWQKPGDQTNFQKFTTDINNATYTAVSQSDIAYSDASFIRLKNTSISYGFPEKIVSKFGLNSLRLYSSAQNLFTLTKFKGLDPENQSVIALPPLKVITFGIQVGL